VNYAWVNRQVIMSFVRDSVYSVLRIGPKELGGSLVYDVSHNIAKFETHKVNGEMKKVCVHRKGATRAFPKGHPLIPDIYKHVGHPVLIPGDMGRASYVLVGTEAALDETFGSSCHGAGRMMSRTKALKLGRGRDIISELGEKGIIVMARGRNCIRGNAQPISYRRRRRRGPQRGIANKVARLRPIGVKG
jgi:tRNA-splicing ligase RtcB